MKALDESGTNKDFTEKSTDWIATDGNRCTDDNTKKMYVNFAYPTSTMECLS